MFASTSADAEERLRNLVDTTGADASSPASTGAIVSLEVCLLQALHHLLSGCPPQLRLPLRRRPRLQPGQL